jgi:hypothetical protein
MCLQTVEGRKKERKLVLSFSQAGFFEFAIQKNLASDRNWISPGFVISVSRNNRKGEEEGGGGSYRCRGRERDRSWQYYKMPWISSRGTQA